MAKPTALLGMLAGVLAVMLVGCEPLPAQPAPAPPTVQASRPGPTVAPPPTPASTPTFVPTPAATATWTPSPTPRPTPTPVPTPQPVALAAAFGGRSFSRPVEIGAYPGGRLFLADQDGLVLILEPDGSDAGSLLDLRCRVRREGNEEGLLSVALEPSFDQRPYLWAYYSVAGGARRTRLARFQVDAGGADLAAELVVLEVAQPFSNHNGGAIRFGPDGMLYLSLGDGGSGGDPLGHGQNTGTLLGSILRLDVSQAAPGQPYAVPPDNPFVGGGGLPEIWSYGLRNPWRMAFDPDTGKLWAADVGQGAVEEVDIIERGGNYGWSIMEGDRCYPPGTGCAPAGTVLPVASYTHALGCSVTGGVVYRGVQVPQVAGAYLYGDFCSGRVWAMSADAPGQPVQVAAAPGNISSFGTGPDGEVYLLLFNSPVLRVTSP